MDAWKLSLRCLQHPFTITAVGLLLFNDHYLKYNFPSAATGKLSDFAGLFFFPFLLAAAIALLLRLFNLKLHGLRVVAAALMLTLICFAAIKAWPAANAWASTLGGVRIVRDPTDLLALVMLLPAGLLARKLARSAQAKPAARAPSMLAYFMLAVASLATAATSPCIRQSVERVAIYEDAAYLQVPGSYDPAQVYHSTDGLTWAPVPGPVPADVDSLLANAPQLPKVVCAPQNQQVCYRISGSDLIESSTDGGQTWIAAWQIPAGREQFMLRKPMLSCKTRTTILVLDLAVLQPARSAPIVVGAMGEEGVVIRAADGTWQRVAVDRATPSPLKVDDPFSAAWTVVGEMTLLLLFGLAAFWTINVWGWHRLTRSEHFTPEERKPARRPPWIVMLLTLAGGVTLGVIGIDGRMDGAAWFVIIGMLCGLYALLLTPFITWGRVKKLYKAHDLPARLPRRAAWLCAALLLPVPEVLLTLWGLGTIAHYWVALLAAIGAGIVILLLVIFGISKSKLPPSDH